MNPLIRDILESLLRKGATAIATYLVTTGLLTEGQATEVVAGLVLLGVSIAWSIYRRYKDRLQFLTAIEAPPGNHRGRSQGLGRTAGCAIRPVAVAGPRFVSRFAGESCPILRKSDEAR